MKPHMSIKNICKLFSLVFSTLTALYLIYIVVLVIFLPAQTFIFPLLQPTDLQDEECNGNLANDTIIKVKNSRTYLVAAYLDLRGSSSVRVLGITYRYEQEPLYCQFCFYGANDTVVAEFQIHTDHFDFPYGTTDIVCNLRDNRIPRYVAIHRGADPAPSFPTYLKIQNIKPQGNNSPLTFEYDFLICISALFGSYRNILQFIQSMEMYQMLGAQKVIIYHTDSSPLMKKILSYYTQLHFIEVISWPITSFLNVSTGWHYPEHPGNLHYYGQTAALNDCIYRNMYRSKYIALNDIDELILPVVHRDWPEMMEYLLQANPMASIFIFENHFFPTTLQDKTNSLTPEDWNAIPGLNILQHTYREPNRPYEVNPTKMILNPRKVVRTSVHSPLDFIGDQYHVSSDIARLCHYRGPKQKELEKEYLIEDTIMSKYETALIERVNAVWNNVNLPNIARKKGRK
ncbi:hypothetical protein FKM82_005420 [Ascaphus truei]|uniref:beta-1,4-galactosyltransferase galt-1-like n=1 Tax=Ascaphus truei TaxID=8439 RepID=UPI003F595D0A